MEITNGRETFWGEFWLDKTDREESELGTYSEVTVLVFEVSEYLFAY